MLIASFQVNQMHKDIKDSIEQNLDTLITYDGFNKLSHKLVDKFFMDQQFLKNLDKCVQNKFTDYDFSDMVSKKIRDALNLLNLADLQKILPNPDEDTGLSNQNIAATDLINKISSSIWTEIINKPETKTIIENAITNRIAQKINNAEITTSYSVADLELDSWSNIGKHINISNDFRSVFINLDKPFLSNGTKYFNDSTYLENEILNGTIVDVESKISSVINDAIQRKIVDEAKNTTNPTGITMSLEEAEKYKDGTKTLDPIRWIPGIENTLTNNGYDKSDLKIQNIDLNEPNPGISGIFSFDISFLNKKIKSISMNINSEDVLSTAILDGYRNKLNTKIDGLIDRIETAIQNHQNPLNEDNFIGISKPFASYNEFSQFIKSGKFSKDDFTLEQINQILGSNIDTQFINNMIIDLNIQNPAYGLKFKLEFETTKIDKTPSNIKITSIVSTNNQDHQSPSERQKRLLYSSKMNEIAKIIQHIEFNDNLYLDTWNSLVDSPSGTQEKSLSDSAVKILTNWDNQPDGIKQKLDNTLSTWNIDYDIDFKYIKYNGQNKLILSIVDKKNNQHRWPWPITKSIPSNWKSISAVIDDRKDVLRDLIPKKNKDSDFSDKQYLSFDEFKNLYQNESIPQYIDDYKDMTFQINKINKNEFDPAWISLNWEDVSKIVEDEKNLVVLMTKTFNYYILSDPNTVSYPHKDFTLWSFIQPKIATEDQLAAKVEELKNFVYNDNNIIPNDIQSEVDKIIEDFSIGDFLIAVRNNQVTINELDLETQKTKQKIIDLLNMIDPKDIEISKKIQEALQNSSENMNSIKRAVEFAKDNPEILRDAINYLGGDSPNNIKTLSKFLLDPKILNFIVNNTGEIFDKMDTLFDVTKRYKYGYFGTGVALGVGAIGSGAASVALINSNRKLKKMNTKKVKKIKKTLPIITTIISILMASSTIFMMIWFFIKQGGFNA